MLKNKRILITAGPTWVPIDSVRVISNIATGETGILLAERLQRLGAKVTLLLGPAQVCCLNKKIRLMRFCFFDELRNTVIKEIRSQKYDVLIHSAAVSDYKPQTRYNQKVKSGKKNWRINLIPTEKIIDLIKKIDGSLFLVGFKFQPQATKARLIKETKELIERAGLNLAVANTVVKNKYTSHIIKRPDVYGPFLNRASMAERLINLIGDGLCKN